MSVSSSPRHPRTSLTSNRRVAALLAALAAGLALVVGPAASGAQAHDELVSSNPADGATVATVPSAVVLTFEEPPAEVGIVITVVGPSGPVQAGSPVLTGSVLTQALAPEAPAGRYAVAWRVTSDDGHPVSGTFSFAATAASVASVSTTTPSAVPTTSSAAPTTSSAAPTTSSASPSTSPTSPVEAAQVASSSSTGGSAWTVVLVVVAVLVVLGLGSALLVRRSRRRA